MEISTTEVWTVNMEEFAEMAKTTSFIKEGRRTTFI